MPVANRMLWRCHALARLQLYQEFFALANIGLMLLANDVELGVEYAHLHKLLESAISLQPLPGMNVYYQLSDTIPDLDLKGESMLLDEEGLQAGRPLLEILIERYRFRLLTRDDTSIVLDNNVQPIILNSDYLDLSLEEILGELLVESRQFDSFPDTENPLEIFIGWLEVFGLFQTDDYMTSREVYQQLRMLRTDFSLKQGYVAQFKAILGGVYEQSQRAFSS